MPTTLKPTTDGVETAAQCIRGGGVVVAPSDTNMALTVDPSDTDAVERVYDIKDRPAHKPLTLFVRDPDDWGSSDSIPSQLPSTHWPTRSGRDR